MSVLGHRKSASSMGCSHGHPSTVSPVSPLVPAPRTGQPVPEERCSRGVNSTRWLMGKRLRHQHGSALGDPHSSLGPVPGAGEARAGDGPPGGSWHSRG